jgi:hypothetical protein
MASAAITAGAAVVGTALSAASTIAGGISQAHTAAYEAAVARNNQTEAEQNAKYATEAGVVGEEEAGQKAAAQLGAVKAGIAANNVDVNSGSALNVEQSQRETGLLSEETVSNNAALQAYGYETQATGYGATAGLESTAAAQAIPGSLLAAGGSLGTNIGTLPSKFANIGGGVVDEGDFDLG